MAYKILRVAPGERIAYPGCKDEGPMLVQVPGDLYDRARLCYERALRARRIGKWVWRVSPLLVAGSFLVGLVLMDQYDPESIKSTLQLASVSIIFCGAALQILLLVLSRRLFQEKDAILRNAVGGTWRHLRLTSESERGLMACDAVVVNGSGRVTFRWL